MLQKNILLRTYIELDLYQIIFVHNYNSYNDLLIILIIYC